MHRDKSRDRSRNGDSTDKKRASQLDDFQASVEESKDDEYDRARDSLQFSNVAAVPLGAKD